MACWHLACWHRFTENRWATEFKYPESQYKTHEKLLLDKIKEVGLSGMELAMNQDNGDRVVLDSFKMLLGEIYTKTYAYLEYRSKLPAGSKWDKSWKSENPRPGIDNLVRGSIVRVKGGNSTWKEQSLIYEESWYAMYGFTGRLPDGIDAEKPGTVFSQRFPVEARKQRRA